MKKKLTFCKALEDRIDQVAADREEHVMMTWSTHTSATAWSLSNGKKSYDKGDSKSSWLQHLVLAALNVSQEEVVYHLEWLPICYLGHGDQAPITEPMLTAIADSMYVIEATRMESVALWTETQTAS